MLLLLLILVGLVSAVSCWGLAKLAPNMKLLALPGEHRQHQEATPMVGGIAIYLAILFGFLMIDRSFIGLLPSLFLVFAVGTLDDRYNLPSWVRFIVQGAAAYLMIKLTGVQLNSLGFLVSESELRVDNWSTPLTIFACIGVINAINMTDGLDGLLGSLLALVLIVLLFLGCPDQGLILIVLFSLSGFLLWNVRIGRPQARVFMGDSGSTLLGLLIAYLLIKFSQIEHGMPPVLALWLLAVPLIDTVSLLLIRPLRGRSPFSADRMHYHHQLGRYGLGANGVLLASLLLQLVFIIASVAMWLYGMPDYWQFFGFLSVFFIYLLYLYKKFE